MKIKRRLLIYLIIIIFTVLMVNKLVINTNDHTIKGNISIWVEDKYYSYFTSIAKEFEENNKKVSIKIVSVKKEDYLYKIINTSPNESPNIVHLDFNELNIIRDRINFTNENKEIIDTYNKNFNNTRLEEVKINDNYYAIPFTSNPIALYLRSDILKKFGYKVEDINTWGNLIDIGKDIYTKSNGDINIFSSQDKENIRLLLSAQLVDYEEKNYENNEINDIINSIYNESFINDNNYLCRISSIDFYSELINQAIDGVWECKNPPSFNIGENKFYDIGGENLVALNIEDNKEVIKSFISYASTNKELLSKEMFECNFVPSSLYSLRTKYISKECEKLEGSSPFLILSNIVERAPEIKNYDKFNEIIYNLYN
ncbi:MULTISPECIES: ABC transporter substrate-binding protein [unclassified Clostridium]|uniref:ABC transporter substrate-binding protein n=1 Tax=unclassified Clostridium TaxID=2614128 RepID=UPI0018990AF0|nr:MULTISPECIES: ABC transporter substrate-binding protein [unclassified Clostridium]